MCKWLYGVIGLSIFSSSCVYAEWIPIQNFKEMRAPLAWNTPYEARYVVQWHAMNAGESTHRLSCDQRGVYTLESTTEPYIRLLPYTYREIATMLINKEHWKPLRYLFHKKEGRQIQQGSIDFDWSNHLIRTSEGELPLQESTWDKLSHTLKMRYDLMHDPRQEYIYAIADRDQISSYRFYQKGSERLQTPLGHIDTVIWEHVHKDRRSVFWLARDQGFLLIRIAQYRDDHLVGGGHLIGLSVLPTTLGHPIDPTQ